MQSKKGKILIAIGVLFLVIVIFTLFFLFYKNEKQVAVLGYHSVLPAKLNSSTNGMVIDLELFEEHLKLLKKKNYDTLTLDEFTCWMQKKCDKKHKSVLITFDDGYYDNYQYAFDLLKKYKMNAVVFIIGDNTEKSAEGFLNKETIEKCKKEYPNIEFASHTYNLHFKSEKTYEQIDLDAKKMKEIIDTKYIAYPFGDYNQEYIKALKDNGYELAFTFGPEYRKADISDNIFAVPRLSISNDVSTLKLYLRLKLPL